MTDRRTDGRTDGRTDARGKTICLLTLSGGDIMINLKRRRFVQSAAKTRDPHDLAMQDIFVIKLCGYSLDANLNGELF